MIKIEANDANVVRKKRFLTSENNNREEREKKRDAKYKFLYKQQLVFTEQTPGKIKQL